MEEKILVKFFVRPNGEVHEITELEMDARTNKIKICLENKLARWFRMDEILVVPPVIKMRVEV
jgi:hypothetical protein